MVQSLKVRGVDLSQSGRRLRRTAKQPYHFLNRTSPEDTRILFILGCQRSGTTLLTRIFDRDWQASVYHEKSTLSSRDEPKHLRLNPLPEVAATFDRNRAGLIVAKPLVESQNAPEILDGINNSRAIWLYRHYDDVAASYVRKWGFGHSMRDLRSIVNALPDDWRYEKVSDELREVVIRYFDEEMNSYDASALYWLVRNQVYFDLELENDPRVILCQYEKLATDPLAAMERIYDFIGVRFPGPRIVAEVHTEAIRRRDDVPISAEVRRLCMSMMERLDEERFLKHDSWIS